jgi:branched-chain amino acid transport system permease protein
LIEAQLLNGVALGSILALVALGLTIIFGLLGFVNFAHGGLFAVGAYAGWLAYTRYDSFALGIVAALVVVFVLGIVVERVLIRYYYARPKEDQILVTYGLGIVLVETLRAIFTSENKLVPTPSWASGAVQLGDLVYPEYRLVVVGIVIVTLGVVWTIIFRTRLGLIVRAGIDDSLIVEMLGIDIGRAFMLVFALGAAVAGLAGFVDAPILALTPDVGTLVLVQSLVVIVIGGVGSFGGAIAGGIVAGEIVSLTSVFAPDWAQVALYLAMALVLILRPQGLFGVVGRA